MSGGCRAQRRSDEEEAEQARGGHGEANGVEYDASLPRSGHRGRNLRNARKRVEAAEAGEHDLTSQEVSLANAFLREFDARVALYADLARQREESERQLKSIGADDDRRYGTLHAETQRLKKALAEAERKLEAAAQYVELASEVRVALIASGLDAFRVECFWPATSVSNALPTPRRWEQRAEALVASGVHAQAIRYRDHVAPLVAQLKPAVVLPGVSLDSQRLAGVSPDRRSLQVDAFVGTRQLAGAA